MSYFRRQETNEYRIPKEKSFFFHFRYDRHQNFVFLYYIPIMIGDDCENASLESNQSLSYNIA